MITRPRARGVNPGASVDRYYQIIGVTKDINAHGGGEYEMLVHSVQNKLCARAKQQQQPKSLHSRSLPTIDGLAFDGAVRCSLGDDGLHAPARFVDLLLQ